MTSARKKPFLVRPDSREPEPSIAEIRVQARRERVKVLASPLGSRQRRQRRPVPCCPSCAPMVAAARQQGAPRAAFVAVPNTQRRAR